MIKELTAQLPDRPLAPNGHHSLLAVSFTWEASDNNTQ